MRVSLIGTGLLGEPIAARLLGTGHQVTVFNRTPSRAAALVERGARRVDSVAEALLDSPATLFVVSDAAAIEDLLDQPGVHEALPGRVVVQMGTIGPAESRRLQARVTASGGGYLEAPVLGSRPQAAAGTLQVLVGGPRPLLDQCTPWLTDLGSELRYLGEVGSAAAVKLALNQLIASQITAFSLSLGLVERAGLEVETFMEILRGSALYYPAQDAKLPRLVGRDFARPNFPAALMLKDVELALAEAEQQGLDTAGLAGVRELFRRAVDSGWAESDYSSVFETVVPSAP